MSTDSVSKLLNISAEVRQPHAYQVFGLADGEQDANVVQHSIQTTIQHLRDVRASCNPEVWNQAAQLVQQARGILSDPQKKADLDARFGIISISAEDEFGDDSFGIDSAQEDATVTPQPATLDPLAGLLPNSNPLAPVTPVAALNLTPTSSPVLTHAAAVVEPAFSPPKLRASSPVIRRKRSSLPMLLLGFVIIGLTFTVMGMTYFLVWGPGQIAINTSSNGVQISSGSNNTETTPQVSTPPVSPVTERKRERDPIMGTLGPDLHSDANDYSAPLEPDSPPDMATSETAPTMSLPTEEMTAVPPAPDTTVPDTISPAPATMEPTPEAMPDKEMTPMPETVPATIPSDPQMTQAADAAIEQSKQAIKKADWANMKTLAEKAEAAAVTDQQLQTAQAMFQLVDLATFYRGGIDRAIKGLTVGNTFEVTEGLEIAIVDVTEDELTFRTAAKNKSYPINELPLVLAHKLASFHVEPDATGIAAKAAYQAITPISTQPYRDEAVMWLNEINDEIAGAERDNLIAAIQMVYEN